MHTYTTVYQLLYGKNNTAYLTLCSITMKAEKLLLPRYLLCNFEFDFYHRDEYMQGSYKTS